MKKIITSIIAACFCTALSGQFVDRFEPRPNFPGYETGDIIGFKKWVEERLVFDPEAKAEGLYGIVTLLFTVEADGSVDKVEVARSLDPRLDAEAVRVVSSSPKWEWHTDNPKPVRYVFPVFFVENTPNPYPFDEFEYEVKMGKKGKEVKKKLRIYSVSHGSVVIKTSFHTIYIDPVMDMGGKSVRYGWFKSELGYVTVLLTHEHGDHFSKEAIDYLYAGWNSTCTKCVYGNRKTIDALGDGVVLNNGDTVSDDIDMVHIKAVPAYNTTRGHLNFHPKGNGNGYLIEIGDMVIYVAGDTEVIPEMKELGKVDIALLPVNQPYTMTPKQCIKAAKIIKPKVLIPYHMGDTDMTPVLKAFKNSNIQVIFHEELR